MAASTEIQSGSGYIYGVGAVTLTPSAGTAITGNFSSMRWTDSFKEEEMASQTGAVIEGLISSMRRRTLEFDFAASGADRTAALAAVDALLALTPNIVITVAAALTQASPTTDINTTYNFKSGAAYTRSREGAAVCSLKLETYETSTPNTFAARASIT